ncbi:MAG: hypothetical protein IJX38_05140 [Clostridia bacterium]|nr:hypothetical protein [Clostridia bacterium]
MATQRRQAAWSKEEIYVNIESSKKSLGDEYRRCRKAAADLASAKKRYHRAVEVNAKRSTNGSAMKLDSATDALSYVYGEFVQVKRNMTSLFDFIEEQYQTLEDMTAGKRKRTKIRLAAMRFADEFRLKSKKAIGEVERGLPDFLTDYSESDITLDELDEIEELDATAESTARAASAGVGVASVSLAPVTIDISEIVERSVSAAVDKLTAKLNKKIEEYIDGLVLPVPLSISCVPETAALPESCTAVADTEAVTDEVAPDNTVDETDSAAVTGDNTVILPAEISAPDESELDARITDSVGSIARILDELERLNAACLAIAEGQQQLAQMQKQTNDVQRHTMREQKGVQVSQRLVSSEQVELAADQAVIADRQAKLNADYKALSDVQTATEETQRAISDAQHELLSTVKKLSRRQRSMAASSDAEKAEKK